MDTASCISEATWEAYALKTLSPGALQAVEQHAAQCPVCADIKGGIDAMADPNALGGIVASLHTKVDERLLQNKKSKGLRVYLSIAAVLLAFMSIGWLLFNNNNNKLAMQSEHAPADKNAPAASALTPATIAPATHLPAATPTVDSKSKGRLPDAPLPEPRPVAEIKHADAAASPEAVADLNESQAIIADDAKTLTTNGATQSDRESDHRMPDSIEPVAFPAFEARAIKKEKSVLAYKSKAPATFPSDQFSNISLSNTGLNQGYGSDSNAAFYQAASRYYALQQFDSCLQSVTRYNNAPSPAYLEDALLLQANALLKLHRKDEARQVLARLVDLKGKRRKDAEALLKNMGK